MDNGTPVRNISCCEGKVLPDEAVKPFRAVSKSIFCRSTYIYRQASVVPYARRLHRLYTVSFRQHTRDLRLSVCGYRLRAAGYQLRTARGSIHRSLVVGTSKQNLRPRAGGRLHPFAVRFFFGIGMGSFMRAASCVGIVYQVKRGQFSWRTRSKSLPALRPPAAQTWAGAWPLERIVCNSVIRTTDMSAGTALGSTQFCMPAR